MTRTQWLDLSSLEMANLIGKNIVIVDEVDDTRTTLEYAVRELQKDVETASKKLGRQAEKTKFSIFVLHNKEKTKKGHLPNEMWDEKRYLAARTVGDVWICYPWEATYVPFFIFHSFITSSFLRSVCPDIGVLPAGFTWCIRCSLVKRNNRGVVLVGQARVMSI